METATRVLRRVEREVARAARRETLWSAGETLVVAVSGGADSLCLVGALLGLQARRDALAPGRLIVAHLDHRLRGAAGHADAEWVAQFAAAHDLQAVVEQADVASAAQEHQRSLEDAARQARYAFLHRVAASHGSARICVGHTSDDQAETLVMQWLRGSGLAGLAGMAPLRGLVARPLLGLTHADCLAYCVAQGWQPRVDATNDDLHFRRNRIRHALLPTLEQYNPALRQTLIRNAQLVHDDERLLETQALAAWTTTLLACDGERITFSLEELREQPPALQHRLWRRVAQQFDRQTESGQPAHAARGQSAFEARHLFALDALVARGRTNAALDLPGDLTAQRSYTTLTFARHVVGATASTPPGPEAHDDAQASAMLSASPLGVRLPLPGVATLPAVGWQVRAWVSDLPPGSERTPVAPPALPPFALTGTQASAGHAETRVYLDADAAGDDLWVRTWRPGDRFRPLGMPHDKKLQDFFADTKLPRAWRSRVPLVCNRTHLLWVAGQRIDDRARLTAQTRRFLVLQLEALANAAPTLTEHAD